MRSIRKANHHLLAFSRRKGIPTTAPIEQELPFRRLNLNRGSFRPAASFSGFVAALVYEQQLVLATIQRLTRDELVQIYSYWLNLDHSLMTHQSMNRNGSQWALSRQCFGPPLVRSPSADRNSSAKIGWSPTRRNQYRALAESGSIRWSMPCQ